jgi:NRPS condensation-like uncharacterized protein
MPALQKKNMGKEQIFDLDGSGIIYAVTNKKTWNRVFRVAAVMKEDVQPEILKQAVTDLRERFPTYFVQLDNDFYKYKFRTVNDTDVVGPEDAYPCGHIDAGFGNKPMFRVKWFKNRISFEIFHIISDGTGAMAFLKNIVARYLELLGCEVEKAEGVLDLDDRPSEAELEDSYKNVKGGEGAKPSRKEAAAYKYKQPMRENFFMLTHGFFTVDDIKRITKEKGVTITDYLAALYTWALYENMLPADNKKPIKLSVPIDLRRTFGSVTLRGFALYVNTAIYPGDKKRTFDDILTEVAGQLKEGFKKENLAERVAANTAAQNSTAFRLMPLALKKTVLKIGYLLLGEKTMTTAFTNLGVMKVPAGFETGFDHFDFVAGGTMGNYLNCAIATHNGIVNVIFTSRSEATDVQQTFFTFLAEQGINIDIQSNVKQKAVDSVVMLHCDDCNINYKENHLSCPLCGAKGVHSERQPLCITAPYPEL